MLVLTRRVGEEIVIAGDICVSVLSINRGNVRIGIVAPPEVRVDRQEIHTKRLLSPNGPPPRNGQADGAHAAREAKPALAH